MRDTKSDADQFMQENNFHLVAITVFLRMFSMHSDYSCQDAFLKLTFLRVNALDSMNTALALVCLYG
jgi:hypothetical protein